MTRPRPADGFPDCQSPVETSTTPKSDGSQSRLLDYYKSICNKSQGWNHF